MIISKTKLAALVLAISMSSSASYALNIVLTNDDSWNSYNIKALKSALIGKGHSVVVAAPCTNQSGKGGKVEFLKAVEVNTTNAGSNEYCIGDTDTSKAFKDYVEGTPVMSVLYGIDVAAQAKWGKNPDLVISGPNEGNNLGFINNNSGTLGAAAIAIARGIPAIAVSDYVSTGNSDRANQVADIVVKIVTELQNNQVSGQPLLPPFTGLNVNLPKSLSGSVRYKFTNVGWNAGPDIGIIKFSNDLGNDVVFKAYYGSYASAYIGKKGVTIGTTPVETDANSEGVAVQNGYISISSIDGILDATNAKKSNTKLKLKNLLK